MKQHLPTIIALALMAGCYSGLRWFGVMTGWPDIPIYGRFSIPISGDAAQVIISGLVGLSPNLIPTGWFEDVYLMPGRVKELHAAKGTLVSGAQAATALGQTGTVVRTPVEAVKPEVEG